MRRSFAVLTVSAIAVLVTALPTAAKMEGSVSITGPGIPGPGGSGKSSGGGGSGGSLHVDGSEGAGWPVVSGLLETYAVEDEPPPGDLGPRYDARYVIEIPGGMPDIVQHVYPYAEGGPVVYTPPGQEWIGSPPGTAPAGWYRGGDDLMDLLTSAGLPETAPAAAVRPTAPAPGPSPAPWLAGGGLVLLALGVLALRRRPAARGVA
jgi:hypothetical protein